MNALREVLEIATKRWVSEDTVRLAVHRLNYVWKRPRYNLVLDPSKKF